MASIFLSYAREDRHFAEVIARVVEAAGHEVWWDRRIDGGEEFSAEIESALEQSQVIVVAWSAQSIRSRWVRDEAAVGGDSGRLVPVSMDGSLPPMGFRQFHTLDLVGWTGGRKDGRTGELLHSIDRRADAKRVERAPPPSAGRTKRRFERPSNRLVAAVCLVLLAAAAIAFAFRLTNRDEAVHGSLAKPTIALLPITTTSGDPVAVDLAAKTHDSIANALSRTGVPVRLLAARPADEASSGDFLLSGEISTSGDKAVVTVHLEETIHGVMVLSNQFQANGADVRDLPDRVGAHVASNLSNGATLILLDRRRPMDPSLLTDMLGSFTNDDPLQIYQTAKRIAPKAPNVAGAQIPLAFFTGFVLPEIPREEREQAVAEGRRAAIRTLQLAPEFGDTYGSWCGLHPDALIKQCEDQLRQGKQVDPDAPYLNTFLAGILRSVGRFDEAETLSRLSYTHDPYDSIKLSEMLLVDQESGNSDEADTIYQQALRQYPEFKDDFAWSRIRGAILSDDIGNLTVLERRLGADHLPVAYRESGAIGLDWTSRSAVEKVCAAVKDFHVEMRCMTMLAALGDLDSAFAIADKHYPRRLGKTPEETEKIWLDDPDSPPFALIAGPSAAALRRDPRFLALAERVGLLAYWRTGRLPDFCTRGHEPVCRQIEGRS